MTAERSRVILIVGEDELVARKMRAAAAALEATVEQSPLIDDEARAPAPAAIVIDLRIDDAIPAAAALRTRWPSTLIAGYVSVPDRTRWESALEAGYDLVATRGTIAAELRARLSAWTGPATQTRVRLFDLDEVAGRLGVVARIEVPDLGPLAVYHIAKELFAACDVCPHAGARLSEGELERTIVTCPLHGSRFDVTTGERVRGPADEEIPVYRVVVDQGAAYLEY